MKFIYIINRIISFLISCITLLGMLWFVSVVGVARYDAISAFMLLLISFYPRSLIYDKFFMIFVLVSIFVGEYFILSHGMNHFYSKGIVPSFDIIKFLILLIGFAEVIGQLKKNQK